MTDLLFTFLLKMYSFFSGLHLIAFKFFDFIFFFISWLDNVLYKFACRHDFIWYYYEKYFFYFQNRSFNYYSRIVWKPALNISDHIFNVPIFFVLQTIFIVIMSVWARAVGPRMRMDQLSHLVWKDFVPSLTLILLAILVITIF